jgi:hypothetical protein
MGSAQAESILRMTTMAAIAAGIPAHDVPEAWRAPRADPVAPLFPGS